MSTLCWTARNSLLSVVLRLIYDKYGRGYKVLFLDEGTPTRTISGTSPSTTAASRQVEGPLNQLAANGGGTP